MALLCSVPSGDRRAADGHERRVLREHYARLYDEEDAGRSVCVHDHLGYADRAWLHRGDAQEGRQAVYRRSIAEENAVALASGIAANGGKPVYGVYSTFIQRAYDQISQDLCINSNAATIIVAWGSVYGMNDVTHLGLYDIPMLANIPNLVYLAPTNRDEYLAMLDWSIEQNEYPVAIRMPVGPLTPSAEPVKKDSAV